MRLPRFSKMWSAARITLALTLCVFSGAHALEVRNVAAVNYTRGQIDGAQRSNALRVLTGGPAKIHFFTGESFATIATASAIGNPLFISANAPVGNLDPKVIETHRITITSQITGDSETFDAVETGPNTGVFHILPNVPTAGGPARNGDGVLQTAPNDTLTVRLNSAGVVASATMLIDPGGVVFDSKTNALVSGARVTLINAGTGATAQVFASATGGASSPNPVVTGADGRFSFPAIASGAYRLEIVPPPEYLAPSKVSPGALPPGRAIHVTGSYGGNFDVTLATGAVTLDFPLDPILSGTLFVQKAASRQNAEIGDFVDFTVRVKNVSPVTLREVVIDDRLPFGFALVRKTAQLDGKRLADPRGDAGPDLHFAIGALEPGKTVALNYRTRIGIDALHGDGINRAHAGNSTTPRATSNTATARVLVQSGVFTNRGVIFGKVFVDKNQSRAQDADEPGIAGVRLYLEDGSYVITDSAGKFSF